MKWVMVALFGVGGFICCTNFYLSFLRYPIHRLKGGSRKDYQWVSGIPLLGSLLAAVSFARLWLPPELMTVGIILALIDTGGLHWFAGSMLYHGLFTRRTDIDSASTSENEFPDEHQKRQQHGLKSILRAAQERCSNECRYYRRTRRVVRPLY